MGVFHVPLKTKLVSTSFIVFILVTFSRQARTWEQNEPVEISILVSSEKVSIYGKMIHQINTKLNVPRLLA